LSIFQLDFKNLVDIFDIIQLFGNKEINNGFFAFNDKAHFGDRCKNLTWEGKS